MRRFVFGVWLSSWLTVVSGMASEASPTARVSVAAAANFTYVLPVLTEEFRRSEPGVELPITLGASGNLAAQIRNGAPFDVFLAADTDYPRELAAAGAAEAKSVKTFAVGALVVWTKRTDLTAKEVSAMVTDSQVRKLAIAQPKTAPYGRAAQAAIEKLGLTAAIQRKLVVGESIAQTAQFVETGNADAGFVAKSIVESPRLVGVGRWIEVPPDLYANVSLDHAAVLTTRGASNPAARRFLDFLGSPAAQRILQQYGYRAVKAEPAAPR